MTTGVPVSSSRAQTSSSSGSRGSNRPTCTCTLNTRAPRSSACGDVAGRLGLGIEGRRLQHLRVPLRELRRPLVQPGGHARLVRVRQRREGPHAQPLQDGEPLVDRQRVGDRPAGAVVRLGLRRSTARPWPARGRAGSARARRPARAAPARASTAGRRRRRPAGGDSSEGDDDLAAHVPPGDQPVRLGESAPAGTPWRSAPAAGRRRPSGRAPPGRAARAGRRRTGRPGRAPTGRRSRRSARGRAPASGRRPASSPPTRSRTASTGSDSCSLIGPAE